MSKITQVSWAFLLLMAVGCNRKATPSAITNVTETRTRIDTVTVISKTTDTIPCEDFEYIFLTDTQTDTIYVTVENQVLKVKTVVKHDTVFRDKIIIQPGKVVNRNVGNTKVKNGSSGDNSPVNNKSGNTTKKNPWIWIFIAGYMSSVMVRRIVLPAVTTYFPPLAILNKFL